MVDISLIGSIAEKVLAVGTVFLAYASFSSVSQNRRQTRALVRQALVLKSQQDPVLLVRDFALNQNVATITVENIGNGPAQLLAINSSYGAAKWSPSEEPPSEEEQSLINFFHFKGRIFGSYDLQIGELKFEGKKVMPASSFGYLVNEDSKISYLAQKESKKFSLEVKFLISSRKRIRQLSEWSKALTFTELARTMSENGISLIGGKFDLLAKNLSENEIPSMSTCRFVVDLRRHKSLQEAFSDNQKPGFFTLSHNEVVSRGLWFESQIYNYQTAPPTLQAHLKMKNTTAKIPYLVRRHIMQHAEFPKARGWESYSCRFSLYTLAVSRLH